MVKEAKRKHEEQLAVAARHDSKLLHGYVRHHLNARDAPRALYDQHGRTCTKGERVAQIFNLQFQSVFTVETDAPWPDFHACSQTLGPEPVPGVDGALRLSGRPPLLLRASLRHRHELDPRRAEVLDKSHIALVRCETGKLILPIYAVEVCRDRLEFGLGPRWARSRLE